MKLNPCKIYPGRVGPEIFQATLQDLKKIYHERGKMNLNFYFRISLWCLNRFDEGH